MGKDLRRLAEDAIEGGADVIQIRDKISSARAFFTDAGIVREVTKYFGIQFIVNDRPDIAKEVSADGVHLGQDDLPLAAARAIVGRYGIIGKSCHSLEQALAAVNEGVDYVGFGPIFKTSTKPGLEPVGSALISRVKSKIHVPIVFIGGINASNVKEVIRQGAGRVAVSSAIISSHSVRAAASRIKNILLEKKVDTVRICQE